MVAGDQFKTVVRRGAGHEGVVDGATANAEPRALRYEGGLSGGR